MTSPDNDPQVSLEEAVIARLRAEGLLQSNGGARTMLWGWFAALVLGVGGLVAMLLTGPPPSTVPTSAAPADLYIVALYAGPDYVQPSANDPRLQEHGQWAGSHQAGAAQIIRGGQLKDPIAQFGQPGTPNRRLVGVFTVRARSAADAVRLARSTPHIRHGGSVVVYPTPYKG